MSVQTGTLAPEGVRSMFDRIAPVYDAMNRVMTAGLDRRWRRLAAAAVVRPDDRVLEHVLHLAGDGGSRAGEEESLALQLQERIRDVSVAQRGGSVSRAASLHRAGGNDLAPDRYCPCALLSARVRTILVPSATRNAGSAVMTGQMPSARSRSCRCWLVDPAESE